MKPLLVAVETVVIAIVVAFLILGRAGFVGSPVSYVVVSGHSMEPTFHTGDLVLLTRAGAYRKGEIIAYEVPKGGPGAGLIVIHRIVGGNAREGFLVRGDNKQFADPWRPRPRDIVGTERLMVPKIGLAPRYVRSRIGLAMLAGFITVAIALGGGGGAAAVSAVRRARLPKRPYAGYRWRGGTRPRSRRRKPLVAPAPAVEVRRRPMRRR
jgi:signal peptidase I